MLELCFRTISRCGELMLGDACWSASRAPSSAAGQLCVAGACPISLENYIGCTGVCRWQERWETEIAKEDKGIRPFQIDDNIDFGMSSIWDSSCGGQT